MLNLIALGWCSAFEEVGEFSYRTAFMPLRAHGGDYSLDFGSAARSYRKVACP